MQPEPRHFLVLIVQRSFRNITPVRPPPACVKVGTQKLDKMRIMRYSTICLCACVCVHLEHPLYVRARPYQLILMPFITHIETQTNTNTNTHNLALPLFVSASQALPLHHSPSLHHGTKARTRTKGAVTYCMSSSIPRWYSPLASFSAVTRVVSPAPRHVSK